MTDSLNFIISSLWMLVRGFLQVWLIVGTTVAVSFAVIQERKIWSPKTLPSISIWGTIKLAIFNACWSGGCVLATALLILKYILTFGRSDLAKDARCIGERLVAYLCLRVFVGTVEVRGKEHLPPVNDKKIPAPVYVANHASEIDTAAVYFLNREWKWIAKTSVFYVPGVGQLMALGKHVFIQRTGKNKQSVSDMFEKTSQSLQEGVPVFFFAQGTRWMADRLPFKNGAFSVAVSNQSSVIPLSVDIPRNAWNSSYPFNFLTGEKTPVVTITVHPPISVKKDMDLEVLRQKTMDVIYTATPTLRLAEIPKSSSGSINGSPPS